MDDKTYPYIDVSVIDDLWVAVDALIVREVNLNDKIKHEVPQDRLDEAKAKIINILVNTIY